jgi:hypothetical protein
MSIILDNYYLETSFLNPFIFNPFIFNPFIFNPYNSNQIDQKPNYLKTHTYKLSIPKTLKTKISFTDTNILYEYLSNHNLDFQLEYPDYLNTFIKSHTNKNLPNLIHNRFTFFHDFMSLLISKSVITEIIPNNILNNHIQLILEEFKTCIPSKYTDKDNMIKIFNTLDYLRLNTDKIQIGSFDILNTYIIVTNNISIIIDTDYMILNLNPNPNNPKIDNTIFEIIITRNFIRFRLDENVCVIKLGQIKTAAYAYGKNFTNLICSSYDESKSNLKYRLDYYYNSKNTSKKIRNITYRSNKELYSKTWQNQNQYYEIHYSNDIIDKTIIKCMMSGSDGLRYRGKQTTTTDKITNTSSTTIKFNDQIQYEKKQNVVLTDLINNKLNMDDSTIGWKICQNITGEKRIVKLFIPSDAKKIIPIDEDFLTTNFKERADYAIVMDIQLPDLELETSVYPSETEAFSYIYNTTFSYKVGQQVKPDSFDPRPENGCSNGVHYFRNRRAVFKTYLDSYEEIDL